MFNHLIFSLFLCFTLNEFVIMANPVEIPKLNLSVLPFQPFDSSNLQGFELKENENSNDNRKKRFWEDFIYLLNLYEDYDDSSSEEESSEEDIGKKECDHCGNYTVTFNTLNQVLHIHHAAPPSTQAHIQTPSNNKVENNGTYSNSRTTEQIISLNTKKQEVPIENSVETNHEKPIATEEFAPTATEKPVEPAAQITTIKTETATTVASAVEAMEVTTVAPAEDGLE